MFSNSSKSSNEFFGNSVQKTSKPRQQSGAKNYVFTKFPENSSIDSDFQASLNLICEKYQYSIETCPNTGRIHFQGQMTLTKKMRITQIIKFKHLNMHLEIQRGTQESNDIYIAKNTNTLIKWEKPPINIRKLLQDELKDMTTDALLMTRENLIRKCFSDKETQQYHIQVAGVLASNPNPYLSLHDWLKFDVVSWVMELRDKKKCENCIFKFL